MAAQVSSPDTKSTPDLTYAVNKFGIDNTSPDDKVIFDVDVNCWKKVSRDEGLALEIAFLHDPEKTSSSLRERLISQANADAGTSVTANPAWVASYLPGHPFFAALLALIPIAHAIHQIDRRLKSPAIDRLLGLPDIYLRAILIKGGVAMDAAAVRQMMAGKPSDYWQQRICRAEHVAIDSPDVVALLGCADRLAEAFRAVCPPTTEVSDTGIRHCMADEQKIKEEARRRAGHGQAQLQDTPTELHTVEMREATDERVWRRRIRRQALDAQSWFDTVLRLADKSSPFVSGWTLGAYRERQRRAAEWAERCLEIFNELVAIENEHDSGPVLHLLDVEGRQAIERLGVDHPDVLKFSPSSAPLDLSANEKHSPTSDEIIAAGKELLAGEETEPEEDVDEFLPS